MNYHRMMEEIIASLDAADAPRLLLHSCCGPCSSAVISALAPFFDVTVFYYNPNIDEAAEYERRAAAQRDLIAALPVPRPVSFVEPGWEPREFLEVAAPLAAEPEGGERCTHCYRLRLERTARAARELGYPYFASTLSVSPWKDPVRLNGIGDEEGTRHGVRWLWSDFKKGNGYQRSIELSREYGLYRQDYCGCAYSRAERDRREKDRASG